MPRAKKAGVEAAAALVGAARVAMPAAPVQPELGFDDALAEIAGVPALPKGSRVLPRKAGRPSGAQNLATKQVAEYLLSRYGDPVERVAAFAAMTIEQIEVRLGVSKLQAYEIWERLQAFSARYVRQEMPRAVIVERKPGLRAGDDASDGSVRDPRDFDGAAIVIDDGSTTPDDGEGDLE